MMNMPVDLPDFLINPLNVKQTLYTNKTDTDDDNDYVASDRQVTFRGYTTKTLDRRKNLLIMQQQRKIKKKKE